MPVRNMVALFLAAVLSLMCHSKADRNRYAAGVSQAMDLIAFNYLEDIEYRELYENAMRGMTEGLDGYSGYISPADYQRFQEDIDQEFGGIGILVEFDRETDRLMVMSPLFDTPAARAGIRAGDIILAIDDRDTSGMSFREAVDRIRGKPGEVVRLTILRAGEQTPVEVDVQRAIIPIESVLGDGRRDDRSWDFQLEVDPRITYVRLINFGENTVSELSQVLKTRPPKALIIDVRDNAGGLLDSAIETCDLFLSQGTIVTIRGRDGEVHRTFAAKGGSLLDDSIPIVVLINRFSASASEIVAACLQDHGRARVVGQRTWGKGTVQNVIPIESGRAALKLTTASYWRPNDKNIHRMSEATDEDEWGVRPDPGFEVVLTEEQANEVRQRRRQKDTGMQPTTAPEKPRDEDSDEPLGDPQLGKAVEDLQAQLNQSDAKTERQ